MTDRLSLVDLRSDTVTQPTPAMREAMMAAPLGDDVFGTDPSVNALQEKIAAMLGFEAAMFVPTGTQSNLCAILSHCGRGDEYIVGQQAHSYRWEGGGAAVFGSVQPQPLDHAPDGTLPLAQIEASIKPDDAHFARTRLLALENTLGGKLLPFAYVQAATDLAKGKGLQRHLDGARLFNAATAQAALDKRSDIRAEARRIAQCFDSVSVCFSKGLGAPVGSALVGSREFIARAHRIRKMAGGGMRQAGLLAAAASHALDHHVDRLADDHALAQRLAQGLEGIEGLTVEAPHTNIVFADLTGAAQARSSELIASLNQQGILATGLYRLRFVTHLDVDAAGVDRAVAAIRAFFKS
ncbi:L-threonine aldolase [Variovorax sp. OK605]|jgi:threonine aldolase|uniref:low-specificity L-threonine aldolase n=1 Tax=unclassified Variovorax TaxID=663243 RepID=UPI0008D16B4E|nr:MULTISPECIES: low-specificity L-threonine aldolase [unclassified Variovorax]SEK16607.1 L-threonine aldolase [Variovorax sp. OK202]SFD11957.1 L-threonine aldolase [Variovorax sp. OK212]SFP05312.1 L-threonine aldolase [Variovorax sp. OK605]